MKEGLPIVVGVIVLMLVLVPVITGAFRDCSSKFLAVVAVLLLLLAALLVVARGGRERDGFENGSSESRWILVLDVDETLVHTNGSGVTIDRPHVREFLLGASEVFDELVAFTAGTRGYAAPILDRLEREAGVEIGRRFYRESCTIMQFSVVKDLRRVLLAPAQSLDRVRLLDNTPSTYSLQPQCGVAISSFYGDPDDVALLEALDRLKRMVAADTSTRTSTSTSMR
jgi:CTD nuclear envelope phosphatase 1